MPGRRTSTRISVPPPLWNANRTEVLRRFAPQDDRVEEAMLGRLNHVGVAVPSLDEAIEAYRGFFGDIPMSDVIELPQLYVRVRFLDAPNTQIELLEPMGKGGPIAKFLEAHPKGGQHHLAFEVDDIWAAKADMEQKGATILNEPRIGAHGTLVVFVHPKDFCGVLIELMEPPGHG